VASNLTEAPPAPPQQVVPGIPPPVKNEVEFRLYNRFGTESNIQLGDVPDALPEDSTKEQPAK
jgi:hypothetical protein